MPTNPRPTYPDGREREVFRFDATPATVVPPVAIAAPVMPAAEPRRVRLSLGQYVHLALIAALFVGLGLSFWARVSGCAAQPATVVTPIGDQTKPIDSARATAGDVRDDVVKQSDGITSHTRSIEGKVPPAVRYPLATDFLYLYGAAGSLRQDAGKLDAVQQQLALVSSQVAGLQKQLTDTQGQLRDTKIADAQSLARVEAQRDSALKKWTVVGDVAGGLLLAMAVPLFVEGAVKMSTLFAAGGGGLVVVSSVLLEFARLIGFVGLAVAAAAVVFLACKYVAKVNLLDKFKAIGTDLVQLGEKLKQELAAHLPASWLKFFGTGVTDGVADHTLSPATKAFVAQTRASGTIKLANTTKPTSVPPVTLATVPVAA